MADTYLYDVRCSSCRAHLGVTEVQKWGIYCDAFCAQEIPAVIEEARDALIEAYHRDHDTPVAAMARWFELSRQRMYQLLDARDLVKLAKK